MKKCFKGIIALAFGHPNHSDCFVNQNGGHVLAAFTNGDLIHRQDSKTTMAGMAIIHFQKSLIDILARLPGQSRMHRHFGHVEYHAQFMKWARRSVIR